MAGLNASTCASLQIACHQQDYFPCVGYTDAVCIICRMLIAPFVLPIQIVNCRCIFRPSEWARAPLHGNIEDILLFMFCKHIVRLLFVFDCVLVLRLVPSFGVQTLCACWQMWLFVDLRKLLCGQQQAFTTQSAHTHTHSANCISLEPFEFSVNCEPGKRNMEHGTCIVLNC